MLAQRLKEKRQNSRLAIHRHEYGVDGKVGICEGRDFIRRHVQVDLSTGTKPREQELE